MPAKDIKLIEYEIKSKGYDQSWFKNPRRWRQELNSHNIAITNLRNDEYRKIKVDRIIMPILIRDFDNDCQRELLTTFKRIKALHNSYGGRWNYKEFVRRVEMGDMKDFSLQCAIYSVSEIDMELLAAGVRNGVIGIAPTKKNSEYLEPMTLQLPRF